VFDWWRRLSRAEVLAQPFPKELRAHISRRLTCAELLTDAELEKLEALVRVFNSEKSFEGAAGLSVTEEMRVAIAARACLLVLWRVELDEPLYPGLDAIIIYPSTYRARQLRQEGYVTIEDAQARLGESWTRGVVVLSWDSVQDGVEHPEDGHDVVLHEFAHKLDMLDGTVDGTPPMQDPGLGARWVEVCTREFELLERGEGGDLIDDYGATDAGEFFAVVTETFFTLPTDLEAEKPDLYDVLRTYYRQDPATRSRRPRR
jgi:Mlc titration factor MtfA (ptsG expression regulator)